MLRGTSGAGMMKRALFAVLLPLAAVAAATTTPSFSSLQSAAAAWQAGDYVRALGLYLELLDGPTAADVLEPIALQTGELFSTAELTADGTSPKFSMKRA